MQLLGLCFVIATAGIFIYTRHDANEAEDDAAFINEIKKMNSNDKKTFAKKMAQTLLQHFGEGEENVRSDEKYLQLKKVFEEDPSLKIAREEIKPLLKDIIEEKPIKKSDFEPKMIQFKKALEKYPQYKDLSWTAELILLSLPE